MNDQELEKIVRKMELTEDNFNNYLEGYALGTVMTEIDEDGNLSIINPKEWGEIDGI